MADRIADERSPLIERDSEAAQPEQSVDDATKTIAAPSPEKKRSWWQIGWYTILWLSALSVAVVFVKGFIDADDVEVRLHLISLRSCLEKIRAPGMESRAASGLVVLEEGLNLRDWCPGLYHTTSWAAVGPLAIPIRIILFATLHRISPVQTLPTHRGDARHPSYGDIVYHLFPITNSYIVALLLFVIMSFRMLTVA